MSTTHLNHARQRYGPSSSGPQVITLWELDVEFDAGDTGVVTKESEVPLSGTVKRFEIHPYTALAQNATIKIYESSSPLSTKVMPVSVTQAADNAEKLGYPIVQCTDNAGTAVSSEYKEYVVNGYLTAAFESYASGNRVQVRVFIDTGGS